MSTMYDTMQNFWKYALNYARLYLLSKTSVQHFKPKIQFSSKILLVDIIF